MRSHLIALVTLLAACNQVPGAGTEGHDCRTFPSFEQSCDADLRCIDGTCVQCGELNDVCCTELAGGEGCHPGFACSGGTFDEGACRNDCGLIGLQCCPSNHCDTGDCNTDNHQCEGGLNDPCQSGKLEFTFLVVDETCEGGTTHTFHTDSVEEAEKCRLELIARPEIVGPGEEACELGAPLETVQMCKHSETIADLPVPLVYCGAQHLEECKVNWCLDGKCTWTPDSDCTGSTP